MTTKQKLRQQMLAQRRQLSSQQRAAASQKVLEAILNIPQIIKANCIGMYSSHGGEPDLQVLWEALQQQNKQICFPRIKTDASMIEFASVNKSSDLHLGAHGILEPKSKISIVSKEKIEAVLIPALAFDLQGYRLGWGRGYFDKWLKGYPGFRLGVAYDFQLLKTIPHESHDERVKAIVTEQRLIYFNE